MKRTKITVVLGLIAAMMIVSCSSDGDIAENSINTPEYVDSLIDSSVSPGDDFYSYCNGTWLKTAVSDANCCLNEEYGIMSFLNKVYSSNDPVVDKLISDYKAAAGNKKEINTALVQKTAAQIAEINSLTTLESVMQKVLEMGMRGYGTVLRLAPYPVEGKVKLGLYVMMPSEVPAEAWQLMTNCTEAEAQRQKEIADSITNDWTLKKGVTPRHKTYDGDDTSARQMIAAYAGEDQHYLVYPDGDQDDFLTYTVTAAQMETWKQILRNAVIAFNYNWTHPTEYGFIVCLATGMNPLAYRLAKKYYEIYKDKINREYASNMVEEIRASFNETIQENDWMSETTKSAAIAKSNAVTTYIGCPDNWQESRLGSIPTGSTLLEDMEQINEEYFTIQKNAMSDSPTKDDIWFALSQSEAASYTTNSVNVPEINSLYIYMTVHVPNFCRTDVPDSYNYAMLGSVAGHEFGHSFDSSGSLYGSDGKWASWWTDADMTEFKKRTQKLADYNTATIPYPDIFPDLHSDGNLTNTEDVADLVGLDLALKAMVKHYKAKGATEADILKAKREFFTAYGHAHAKNLSNKSILTYIKDAHSLSPIRVNGVVRHIDEWYDVFNVKSTDKLYLAPADRVKIYNK